MANKKKTSASLNLKNMVKAVPETTITDVIIAGSEYFNDMTLSVKKNLPLKEAMGFVGDLVTTCIDEEKGEFMPEWFDFAVRIYVLVYYAGIEMPRNVSAAYAILYETDLFDRIFPIIDKRQFDVLVNAATSRIEHWRNMMVSTSAAQILKLIQKMDEMMEGSKDVMEKLDDTSFKDAMERLLKLDMSVVPPELNDSITETPMVSTEQPAAEATDTGMDSVHDADGRIIYLPRKD